MNMYQQIDKNKRETVVIIALFMVVISAIGWFVGEYYYEGAGIPFLGMALIFSGISGFISYYTSDKMILSLSRAHEVNFEAAPDLHKLVENMCIASGIPKPRIYLIDDTSMNAFATGRDPQHSVICFTTGIVQRLEKRELEGVIAHEMSHIGNYDIRLMSIVSILVGTIMLLSDWFTRGAFYGGGRRRSSNSSSGGSIFFLVGLVLLILSPIIATLIKLAISRNREYLADATAVLITRHPKGLADALAKLAMDQEILEAANGATAHLYIVSPIKVKAAVTNLFSTHPPIEDRINRLLQM